MRRIDLADPAFEPTDDELATLMQRAFGELKAKRERLDDQTRQQIRERGGKR